MPRVAQVSSPNALTLSTMAQTCSTSRSFGLRQAAPMWNRPAPPALAARASASKPISSRSEPGGHDVPSG
jgi:hypothetical protein